MTTLTTTLTAICTGGNHLTFTITGDKSATVHMELSELAGAISADEIETFCRIIARMAKAGRTQAQARTILQNGVTVTV